KFEAVEVGGESARVPIPAHSTRPPPLPPERRRPRDDVPNIRRRGPWDDEPNRRGSGVWPRFVAGSLDDLVSYPLRSIVWVIVLELVTVALTWWFLIVVASHETGAVHPLAIVRWFETHGWVALAVIFGCMTVISLDLLFVTFGIVSGASDLVLRSPFLPILLG